MVGWTKSFFLNTVQWLRSVVDSMYIGIRTSWSIGNPVELTTPCEPTSMSTNSQNTLPKPQSTKPIVVESSEDHSTTWITASPPPVAPNVWPVLDELDISDTYPKSINLTYAEADAYVRRCLASKFTCAPLSVVYLRFDWDQSVITTIDKLIEGNYGIGTLIENIVKSKDLTHCTIKFKVPFRWSGTANG